MHKIFNKTNRKCGFLLVLCLSIVIAVSSLTVYASEENSFEDVSGESTTDEKVYEYVNPTTNYKALIEDNAELLTDSEREKLLSEMEKITTYGNAAFNTINANNSTADSYASGYYHNKFDNASGTLFLIDIFKYTFM